MASPSPSPGVESVELLDNQFKHYLDIDEESSNVLKRCSCRFQMCECPGLYYDKASNGELVTWAKDSPEADLVKVRNRVRNDMTWCSGAQWPLVRVGTFLCPACYTIFRRTSTLAVHLGVENERLSKVLVSLLDIRQSQPGELSPLD